MSLPTFDSARDEILGLFKTYWDAETPGVNGSVIPDVDWPGVGLPSVPPAAAAWARIRVKHATSRQTTFGTTGNRRFTRPGLVSVQVFSPLDKGIGLSLAEKLAIIARDAFEGRSTATGIWFRNVRIQEIGPSDAWYQMNVIAEFQYDELR